MAKQEEKESEDEESEEPDSTTGTPPRYRTVRPFLSFLTSSLPCASPPMCVFTPTAAHQIRRTITSSSLAPTSTYPMPSGQWG